MARRDTDPRSRSASRSSTTRSTGSPDTAAPRSRAISRLEHAAVRRGRGRDRRLGDRRRCDDQRARRARVRGRPASCRPSCRATASTYRYAGIAGTLRRDTVTVGVARRIGDSLAVGVSVGVSRVTVERGSRRCGPGSRPRRDRAIRRTTSSVVDRRDRRSRRRARSPACSSRRPTRRIELAASVGWDARRARLAATSAAAGSTEVGVAHDRARRRALELHQPLTLRTGARWLGDRWIAEVDGDLWLFRTAPRPRRWQLAA